MRAPAKINCLPGRTITIAEQAWLYFSGTAYLGVTHHPEFHHLIREGIAQYGAHFGGSRKATIALSIYEEVEAFLASYTRMERALVVSSGTLAGQLLSKILRQETDILLAPGVHPALWDLEHPADARTWEAWSNQVQEQALKPGKPLALLCNAIDPLGVRTYDFRFLSTIQSNRPILLVVDDSHGFGVLGVEGAGIFPALTQYKNLEVLGITSLGKASGVPAGAILGPAHWIEKVWQSPFFGGASPATPAFLHAYLHAQPIYARQRVLLQQNLHYVLSQLPSKDTFRVIPGFPALFSSDEALAAKLEAHQILISSFRYPTIHDPVYTRIIVSSLHTQDDLNHLLAGII